MPSCSTRDSRSTPRRKLPVWLAIAAPSAVGSVESWRTLLQGVLSQHGGAIAIVEIDLDTADAEARGLRCSAGRDRHPRRARSDPGRELAEPAQLGWPISTPPSSRRIWICWYCRRERMSAPRRPCSTAWIRARRSHSRGSTSGPPRIEQHGAVIDSELETLGTDVILHAWRSSERLAPALRTLAPLATLMDDDVSVARSRRLEPDALEERSRRYQTPCAIACSSTAGRSPPISSTGATRRPIPCSCR